MAGAADEAHRLGALGGADQITRLQAFDRPLAIGGSDQGAGDEAKPAKKPLNKFTIRVEIYVKYLFGNFAFVT